MTDRDKPPDSDNSRQLPARAETQLSIWIWSNINVFTDHLVTPLGCHTQVAALSCQDNFPPWCYDDENVGVQLFPYVLLWLCCFHIFQLRCDFQIWHKTSRAHISDTPTGPSCACCHPGHLVWKMRTFHEVNAPSRLHVTSGEISRDKGQIRAAWRRWWLKECEKWRDLAGHCNGLICLEMRRQLGMTGICMTRDGLTSWSLLISDDLFRRLF